MKISDIEDEMLRSSLEESRTRRTPPEKAKAWHKREHKKARKSTSRKSRHKGKAALKKGDYDGAGDKPRGTEGRLTH